MTEDQKQRLAQLDQESFDTVHEVDAALESQDEQRQLATGKIVSDLDARYRAFVAELDPADRDAVERKTGRRVIDVKRQAMALSRREQGARAVVSKDAGTLPFVEQRTPSKSIMSERAAPVPGSVSVGGEIESWCGKCKDMRNHHVVAMVSGEAKQVVCQTCNSRHAHKAEPPKSRRGAATNELPNNNDFVSVSAPRRDDSAQRQREEAKQKLKNELFAAENPRDFDPKARYKAGEIIVHPLHGRGKIETITRGSLLVRFIEGLRPLDLR